MKIHFTLLIRGAALGLYWLFSGRNKSDLEFLGRSLTVQNKKRDFSKLVPFGLVWSAHPIGPKVYNKGSLIFT
jgi:hypothetical protein